jgi:dipeptidyl aminopeptidase/acylaminoacyl peptidase
MPRSSPAPSVLTALPCLLLACAPPATAQAPAVHPAQAAPAAPTYRGHGAGSVSPELLAKYAPPPVPTEVGRTVQAMFDVRSPAPGQVSPDGKRLYFGWRVSGTQQVWRLDGPQRFPVQLTGGEDDTRLAGVSPDGKFLLVARDRNGEEYPGLYWLSPEGGPLHVIQHRPRVQTFLAFVTDDSRGVVYRANDIKPDSFAIYRWDREGGARETLFDQPGLWDVADHRPDGRLLLSKELGSSVNEIYEWDPRAGKLTPLLGQGEREEYLAAYGAAEGELLVVTPKLGELRRLYRLRDGKLEPVSPEMKHDVAGLDIDQQRRRVVYSVNEGGYTRLRALDARTLRPLPLPKLPEADHVYAGNFSQTGRYLTLAVDTGKAPLAGYVLDWQTGKVTQWQQPSAPEVDLGRFARATLESYPARDGTPIPMFVRRPASCPSPCPVVVEFHGGPEGQAQPGFSPYAQLIVDAGFVYVEPNVRGSDGYGKTWYHADDGPRRLAIITDIEDCARHLREAWAANGQAPKIAIVGGSYGGYSALIGMTMFAGAYDAGFASVGPSNLVTFLENTAPYRRALRINEYGDPAKDRDALVKLSPITYIDRVKGPLLLAQGANDPRVPAGESIQMHQALEARGRKSTLMIFADEGHGSGKRSNQVIEMAHLLRFLQESLRR